MQSVILDRFPTPAVTNGVRKGGFLKPCLFAVYLDELPIQLGSGGRE